MEKVLFKLLKITLVDINLLSVKKIDDPYRIDVAESKYGNQIAPSSSIFEIKAYKFKNYISIKIHVWYDRLDRANFCLCFSEVCASAVPIVWSEPRNHFNEPYFCVTSTNGFFGKSKHEIKNSNIPSAVRPSSHDDWMPMPEQPEKYTLESEPESEDASPEAETSTREDQDISAYSTVQPHLTFQAELNDLVRAQMLGSRLQQWNLLEKGVIFSSYRKRQSNIAKNCSIGGDLIYCNVCLLMEEFQVHPDPEQWRFFINSFKVILKAVLLYNGKKHPSAPLVHAFTWKKPTPTFKVC